MVKKIRVCDVCGKEIKLCDDYYEFKKFRYDADFFNFQNWHKQDMCEACMNNFKQFVKKPSKKTVLNESK